MKSLRIAKASIARSIAQKSTSNVRTKNNILHRHRNQRNKESKQNNTHERRTISTTKAAKSSANDSVDSFDEENYSGKKNWTSKIQWLPFMDVTKKVEEEPIRMKENEVVLPIFPLGSNVHLPYSEHVLNIFEPRYRAMYNDILFNGSRRFVVPMCDPQSQGHFSKYACVFYLDDLKEVSEQTNDQVKYVCSHTCVSVVRIERIVNDAVWGNRSSYLKGVCVEVGEYGSSKNGENDDDESKTVNNTSEYATKEGMLVDKFKRIVRMQQELDEPVRFREELVNELSAENKKLWRMVELWQSLLTNRVNYKETELQRDVQNLLKQFMNSQGPEYTLNLNTLPETIQNQFKQLQINYNEEARELVNEAIYPFQQLLECEQHVERLDFFSEMLSNEENRLQTKLSLKNLFASSSEKSSNEEDDKSRGQDN